MQRRNFLKTFGVAAGASMIPFLRYLPAEAAGPSDTLVVVSGQGINSLDLHRKGTNRPSYQVTVNIYDRLVRFGVKNLLTDRSPMIRRKSSRKLPNPGLSRKMESR